MTIAVACAEADMTLGSVLDTLDAGPSVPLPEEDAASAEGSADAGSDAAPDADADQATPTCSTEGWCHTTVPDAQTLRDVWGDGAGTVWTVSEQGNILRWDGTAWVQSHAAGVPLYAIWGSSPTDLWAGGGTRTTGTQVLPGVLLHGTGSSPATIEWSVVTAPVTIRSIWGTSATDVWAVASVTHRVNRVDRSVVLHYGGPPEAGDPDGSDAGAATGWEIDPVSTDFPAHFEKVWGTSADDVWIAGRVPPPSGSNATGQVLHRVADGDGALAWRKEQPQTVVTARADLNGISFTKSAAAVVGFHGDSSSPYLHTGVSDDNGATFTWTLRTAAETGFANNALSAVWGTGPNDIWVAGQRGRLRQWDGIRWRVAAVALDDVMPVQNAVHAMWGTGANDIWAVGADIALHKVDPSGM
ncbi:MAG: hypothetical protein BGO98_04545 [Myxococcales bacterium 68-20]|nr:MAG: hypothetical protein BGO98_04545 [Myxococcales bacterium 68-20]